MIFTWEKEAANNDPMPDDLMLAEQKAYQALACLYIRFQSGAVTREQASLEKAKIRSELTKEIQMDNFRDNTAYQREKILRLTEQAKASARKNPSAENCIALADAIDGIEKYEFMQNVILSDHEANCPCCGSFFNQEQADRKPRFCETCGALLVWEKSNES